MQITHLSDGGAVLILTKEERRTLETVTQYAACKGEAGDMEAELNEIDRAFLGSLYFEI